MDIIEIIMILAFVGGMIFLIYKIFKKPGSKDAFKPFVPQQLKKTFKDEVENKLKMHGQNANGYYLYLGGNKISRIDKVMELKSEDYNTEFDEATKVITTLPDEKIIYNLIFFKCFNRSMLLRALGAGKSYYVLRAKDDKNKDTYHIDHTGKKYIFPYYMDIVSYGNIWVNSEISREYLHGVSIKRMLEQTQMYLENQPDKTIHLENETARKERIAKTMMDLEKGKYEESKQTGDTVIQ